MKKRAFPSIELLSVVAIVAVLAAAASPEFLHSGLRGNISRTETDPQAMKMAAAPTDYLSDNADGSISADAPSSDDSYGPVDPPDKPQGPTKGKIKKKLTYTTEGTDWFNVHYYMYDWGDGSKLEWKADEKQTHKYSKSGTYRIRVKESCPLWIFVTDWSKSLKVKISK